MRRPIETACFLAVTFIAAGCSDPDVRIGTAKAPPGVEMQGQNVVMPHGTAVIVGISTDDEDDTIEVVGNANVRAWPTTKDKRTFVLVAQSPGETSAQIKVNGEIEKTIAVTVTAR